jgi:dolichyldiphosphatase
MFRKSGLLEYALDTPLLRLFRVRDLVVEEDLPQSGWEKWEEKRALSHTRRNAQKTKKR